MGTGLSLEAIKQQLSSVLSSIPDGDSISELIVNPDETVYYELRGTVYKAKVKMPPQKTLSVISLLAGYYDIVCDTKNPTLSVRLPLMGGGRVQALIPPIVTGPTLCIRFPAKKQFTLDDLETMGSFRRVMYRGEKLAPMQVKNLLSEYVENKKNILVTGGTGSGKTTLANAMLDVIKGERVIIIEDTPELSILNEDTVYIKTKTDYNTRDAVFTSMRMRPDRIIVGEIRDGSTALELTKAWLTGHEGGIASVHANSATGGLGRISALMKEVVQVPDEDFIREAINVVIHVCRIRENGETYRAVEEIYEVSKLN